MESFDKIINILLPVLLYNRDRFQRVFVQNQALIGPFKAFPEPFLAMETLPESFMSKNHAVLWTIPCRNRFRISKSTHVPE